MSTQVIIFILILLFYLYRAYSTAQKKAKEEAARRRGLNDPQSPQKPVSPSPQKTIHDVLTEVFRETEMKTKPFGDGRKLPPTTTPKKIYPPKPVLQKTVMKPVTQKQQQKKKEVAPFLSTDYTPETVDPEGTPSAMSQDYVYKTQVTDAYKIATKKKKLRFNIREAVIAKIILDRPEW